MQPVCDVPHVQGAHVVAAIRALMAGKPTPLFKAKASTMLVLVLGRKQGLGYMDGTMFPRKSRAPATRP